MPYDDDEEIESWQSLSPYLPDALRDLLDRAQAETQQ